VFSGFDELGIVLERSCAATEPCVCATRQFGAEQADVGERIVGNASAGADENAFVLEHGIDGANQRRKLDLTVWQRPQNPLEEGDVSKMDNTTRADTEAMDRIIETQNDGEAIARKHTRRSRRPEEGENL
jgi:hypothetical protein